MKKRIYFFANFGDWNKVPYGGGEVGNRRTLQLMKEEDYDVVTISKYFKYFSHSKIQKAIVVIYRMIICYAKYLWIMLWGRRENSIAHISGIYGEVVGFEAALVCTAKILGYKTIYEMRGGGADAYYKERGRLYRLYFDSIIKKCDCVFSQGIENYGLIDRISKGKDRFYYPNFVMPDFFPAEQPVKTYDKIRMLYFGRISSTKNVGIILETMKILHEKYDNIELDLVGNYEFKSYLEELENYVKDNNLNDCVHFHPACYHDKLKEHLCEKHIFLFPTSEAHEGHSNAMTEAMAWGLVPVTTTQGFSRSVLEKDELLVEELSPLAFAKVVSKLIDEKRIPELSKYMYERVRDNYRSEIIFKRLADEYKLLFEKWSE